MKRINRVVVFAVGSLALLSTQQINAQATAVSAPANSVAAPASNLSFSPSVWVGARTNLVGNFSSSKNDANTFGPFAKPGFVIKYNSDPISFMAKYTFETAAARGYGAGNQFKSVSNNTYYQHEPIFLLTGKANDSWKINTFGDLWINNENKRSQNTFYELTIQPDLEYRVNSQFSVAFGYQLFRKNYFDTSVIDPNTSSSSDAKAAVLKSKPIMVATLPPAKTKTHSAQILRSRLTQQTAPIP
jgi:hypothetical protein